MSTIGTIVHLPYIADIIPIEFYPYMTAIIRSRIIRIEYEPKSEISKFNKELIKHFNNNNVECTNDNKVVFKCSLFNTTIYYGFYDWNLTIGSEISIRGGNPPH